jgi:hypothetical protein
MFEHWQLDSLFKICVNSIFSAPECRVDCDLRFTKLALDHKLLRNE